MTELQSKLKESNYSGAENATTENQEDQDEIIELEGRGSREEIKARQRSRDTEVNLPGVNK